MYEEVTKDEPLTILSTFYKDKSRGLDGWIVDFFLGLFEILGDALPLVVEEVRSVMKILGSFNSYFLHLFSDFIVPKHMKPSNL